MDTLNLGVYIDSNLTMKKQISNTVKVCNHHLRNITFIRKYLNEDTLKMLIHNHVISRPDYCNSVYHKLPNTLLKKLQNIQNRAARLIKKTPLRERITPALIELHWLPMKARIIYNICLLTYKALKFGKPKYLYEYLVPFELETSATVRHASDHIDSSSQEQTVAVEKDLFNVVPQDYITNYQWKLKIAKTLPNLRKD